MWAITVIDLIYQPMWVMTILNLRYQPNHVNSMWAMTMSDFSPIQC